MGGGKLNDALTFRRKAEEALKDKQLLLTSVRSESELLRLVHELEVRQIDLEMQKEELQIAKEEAELALAKYFEVYEFATSGYFILSREGIIIQLNIAGSQLLGDLSSQLINHPFAYFVSDESKPVLKLFLSRVFNSNSKETCYLSLSTPGSIPVQIHVTGLAEPDKEECFVTVMEIRDQNLAQEKIEELNASLDLKIENRTRELMQSNNKLKAEILERELLNAKLKRSESLFKNMFERHDAIMLLINPINGVIVNANKAASKFYGYTISQLCSMSIEDLNLLPIEKVSDDYNAARPEKKNSFIFRHKLASGEIRTVEVHSSPIAMLNETFLFSIIHDITEAKMQENELLKAKEKSEESERSKSNTLEKLNEAQALAKIGSWEWNIITGEVWWSDELYRIFEVNPDNFILSVESNASFVHPDDNDPYHKALLKCSETGEELDYVLRIITPTGKLKNCRSKARTLFDSERKAVRMAGTFSDITIQVQIDTELQNAKEKYQLIVNNVPDVIYEFNIDTQKFNYVSPSVFELTGYTPEERTKTGFGSIIVPDFADKVNQEIKAANQEFKKNLDSSKRYHSEYQLIHKNGNFFWVETLISFHIGKDGENMCVGITRNIDQRKKAEEANRKSEEKFKHYFEHSLHGKSITQLTGEIYVNQALCDMLGYSREELQNHNWREYTHPDDIELTINEINKLISGEIDWLRIEKRFIHKNGSVVWTEVGTSILKDTDGRLLYLMSSLIDITERKEAEAELKSSNDQLAKTISERDKFFSIIAHDLRGPLGGFMGLTEMMANEDQDITDNERKEMVFNLKRSARNTFVLLETLLEWSKTNHGISDFNPQKVGLTVMVTDCINIIAEPAGVKGIALIVDIPTGQEVFADKNMLQTVIRNLLSNAIKFTPKGGKVIISAKTGENQMTMISVKDTGIGMSDDLKNNLFRIDSNTKRPGTEGEHSTGLGLLLCKEFVDKHGGKILIESELFKGSIFSFTVPSTGQRRNEIADQKVEFVEKPAAQIDNLKILIAEDDEISAKLISLIVKGFSREVLQAKTGADAVQLSLDNPDINIILMDISMPGLNGYEATRQIRQFNKEVVIIAQTTFALPADKEKAIAAGCNDYIAKPIDKAALIELIKKHI